jgi:hypothetical protein
VGGGAGNGAGHGEEMLYQLMGWRGVAPVYGAGRGVPDAQVGLFDDIRGAAVEEPRLVLAVVLRRHAWGGEARVGGTASLVRD